MKNLKRILPMLLALVMVFSLVIGTSAYAAETVKVICPYGAGGVADLVTREYAKAANNVQSDYNFIVENLTGGDGFVANATFSEEAPDTKDLLVMGYGVCYRVDAAAKYDTEEVDFDLTKNVPFCTIDDRTWIMFGKPGTTLADVLAKAKDGGIKMSKPALSSPCSPSPTSPSKASSALTAMPSSFPASSAKARLPSSIPTTTTAPASSPAAADLPPTRAAIPLSVRL